MPRGATIQGDIVKDYLARFPRTANLTLAKKIYAENSPVFKDVETARDVVRYYRGAMGDTNRKHVKDKSFMVIPESFSQPELITPYTLPKASRRILFLSDIHCPYHDVKAVECAVNYGIERKVDTVVLMGDFMDFYRISRFEPDPRKRRLKDEIEVGREMLAWIRSKFPEALIVYKSGNHEERWEAYLKIKAPELLDMEEFQLEVILHFAKLNIIHVGNKRLIKAGRLNVLHGHEYKQGIISPVNIARNYLLKARENIIVGHHHKTSEFAHTGVGGSMTAGWSIGALCDLSPEYMPYNEWNAGTAYCEILDDKGNFRLENKKIYNGKLY